MAFSSPPPPLKPPVSKSRTSPRAALHTGELPVGTIIAAGVSVGILSATFENMVNVLQKRRRRPPKRQVEELCAYCAGFGNVRCEVCGSRGEVRILGTDITRICPLCKGKKWEKCRQCAGSGKSGIRRTSISISRKPR